MAGDEKKSKIKTLQISNISIAATRDQIFSMCQYLGRIDDIKVYPTDANMTSTTMQKVAFVKFEDERCVEVGQHLTNTVLVDRALVCVPWLQETIPDETTFLNSGGPSMAGGRQLPPHVQNRVQTDADGHSILLTVDPTLEQLGLPAYPQLPGDTDPNKVEEIRRTIYVGNLPKGVNGEDVVDFFNIFGEVMYVRMAQVPDSLPCSYAYVEFSQQTSVPIALQNNGTEFQGRPLKIQHSRVAIIKPQQKTADQALEEVEEAIRMGKDKGTTERRSRSPRRRRTPSPKRRSRSRKRDESKTRRRSRSRGRKRSSSRDRDRKRSKSRDRKRSKSRDKDRKRRSRSRDRDRKDRDRRRSRSRSKDRKKEKERKDRKRSRSRSKEREKERKREKRDKSPSKKDTTKDTRKDETSDVEMNEEALREKLLEKVALKNGKTESFDNDSDAESPKTPSKIKNERKRRASDSD